MNNSEFQENLEDVTCALQNKLNRFASLLIKTPGEEEVLRGLFEATAHLQVLVDVQYAFNSSPDEDKMPGIQMFLKRKAWDTSRENSMFGEIFSAEKRLYVSKILYAWF